VTLLEQYIDVGPRLANAVLETDEVVVKADDVDKRDDAYAEKDEGEAHDDAPCVSRLTMRAS
jgi:hypothetical protein